VPILLFILVMIYAANRDFWGFGVGWSLLGVALFVPWTAVWLPLFQALGMGSTAGYAPVPVLILAYAIALWRRAPDTSRGLAIGAGILVVSLIMRMLDEPVCGALPIGTHFWLASAQRGDAGLDDPCSRRPCPCGAALGR